jgi:hypothetical protein
MMIALLLTIASGPSTAGLKPRQEEAESWRWRGVQLDSNISDGAGRRPQSKETLDRMVAPCLNDLNLARR